MVEVGAVEQHQVHFRGPARVFDSEEDATNAVINRRVAPGAVIVVPYEGPRARTGDARDALRGEHDQGHPGVERQHCPPSRTAASAEGTRSLAIGHVSPEAAEGGPISLLQDGDLIRSIDLAARRPEVEWSEGELAPRRCGAGRLPSHGLEPAWLAAGRYRRLVTNAAGRAALA